MLLCHLWPFVALCRGERCEGEGVGARLPSWGGLGPIAASDWKEGEGGPCRAMQGPCRAPPGLGGGCMAPLIEPHLDGGLTALCPPHVRVLILAISTAYVSSETSDKLDNEQRRLAWPLRVWRILHLLRVWGGAF